MSAMMGLWKHESRYFLMRPWASLWLTAWLITCASVSLIWADLLSQSEAGLLPFFTYLPWIGALFLPALGMRLWSREVELGTLTWLLSLPHSTLRCILIKHIAACQLLILALIATWPLPLTIVYLGDPDLGVMISSYLGMLGFLSGQLALCHLASTLCRRPLAAYGLGLILCLLYNLPGCDLIHDKLPHVFSSGWFEGFSRLGPTYHVLGFLRGVIDLRDVFYALGSTLVCLGLAFLTLIWKRSLSSSSWRHPEPRTTYGLSILGIMTIILLIAAQHLRVRWDLTEERLYTLSDGSRAIVEKLSEPLRVTFFFSRSHPELDPHLRSYGQRIEELLREFAASSPQRFQLRTIDPRPQTESELDARVQGLLPLHTQNGDTLYFGAIYTMGQQMLSIPYFDPQKEDQLEYELAEAAVKIAQRNKPVLGILSSLPVVGDSAEGGLKLKQDWAFVAALRNLYQIVSIAPDAESIPDSVRTLLVVHPKTINEKTEYAIDQFLLSGGNLLIALDPFCRADLVYTTQQGTQAPLVASDLPRLLKAWGLSYSSDQLVGNRNRSTKMQAVYQKIDYPFHMEFKAEDFTEEHPITLRIRQLLMAEAGYFAADAGSGLQWIPLVRTSPASGTVPTQLTTVLSAGQLAERLAEDGQERALAGMIRGRFRTAFPIPPAGTPISRHREQADKDNAIVLVADVDFIADHNSVEKRQSLNQMVFKPKNDNLGFLLKSVEFVGGNKDLIAVRSSSRLARPLTRLVERQERAREQWQEEFDRLGAQVTEIERRLTEMQAQMETSESDLLSPEQQKALQALRLEEAQMRAQRRDVRLQMQEDEKQLRQGLTLLNHAVGPLAIGIFWSLGLWFRHRQRPRRSTP